MSLAERSLFVATREATAYCGATDEYAEVSRLLIGLLRSLAAAGVPYCYWKRVSKLELALSGQSDLDLLVSRTARDALFQVLQAHGFLYWPEVEALRQPASVSFLGHDEASGKILHVHVHFRLALGDALAKNVRIPIEEDLISRSRLHPRYPIRVLDPCDEALVPRLRQALEGGWLDIVGWKRRLAGAGEAESSGPADDAIDREALRARAGTFLSRRSARLLAEWDRESDPAFRSCRRAIRWETRRWRSYGSASLLLRRLYRSAFLMLAVLNRRAGLPAFARRPAPGGGVLIAFVGLDGSGKSTQVRQAGRWLDSELDVRTQYFGSGDGRASLLFRPVKLVAEAIGSRLRVKPMGASHGRVSDRPPGLIYSYLFVIWALAVALDKRAKLASTRRAVDRGFIVVTDRYPQSQIVGYNDGPLLDRIARAPQWLRRLERSVYESAGRTPPDLVIKLHVDADTVARREPEMRPDLIRRRIAWLNELSFGKAKSISIDASQPIDAVSEMARRAIWSVL